jgi:hypothetical protein
VTVKLFFGLTTLSFAPVSTVIIGGAPSAIAVP